MLLEADDPPEAVGRQLATVDEAVERPRGDAEATLTDAWGRGPTDDEITPYWTDVVELNRPLLPNRDNPDLIFSGQVFRLPDPPPAPAPPPAP